MEFVDEGVIRCICGTTEDDGFTIQCEKCFVWQHAICVDITQDTVPDIYYCEQCSPRPLDAEKAAALQLKRIRNEKRKLKLEMEEEKRKLNKQSPRRRKESNEYPSQNDYTRKRTGDGPLSPRKRFKDLGYDSPSRVASGPTEMDDWGFQSGRNRLLSTMLEFNSYTQKPIAEPTIQKKKDLSAESAAPVNFGSVYEAEYSLSSFDFSIVLRNKYTDSVYKMFESWLEKSKSWPLTDIVDSFLENDDVPSTESAPCVAVLASTTPWSCNSFYGSINGAKLQGSFATTDLSAGSFISEIKGTICTSMDLDLKSQYISYHPIYNQSLSMPVTVKTENESAQNTIEENDEMNIDEPQVEIKLENPEANIKVAHNLNDTQNPEEDTQNLQDIQISTKEKEEPKILFPSLLPPFVFPFNVKSESISDFFMDSRDYGDYDARYTRSSCTLENIANAELRVVVMINDLEVGDRPMLGKTTWDASECDQNAPSISISDRFKLCVFATRPIGKGEEIILAQANEHLAYPCFCPNIADCIISKTVEEVEKYRQIQFNDSNQIQDAYINVLQTLESNRQMFLAAKEEEERDKVPEIWNYTVKREFRLPDTDEESLEETEEIFSIHAEDEVSPKFETDNNEMDIDNDDAPAEPIKEEEPEKAEPVRVSFSDFMKQLSTNQLSPMTPSIQERSESEQQEPIPVAEPTVIKPMRVSLDSASIKALAESLGTSEIKLSVDPEENKQEKAIDTPQHTAQPALLEQPLLVKPPELIIRSPTIESQPIKSPLLSIRSSFEPQPIKSPALKIRSPTLHTEERTLSPHSSNPSRFTPPSQFSRGGDYLGRRESEGNYGHYAPRGPPPPPPDRPPPERWRDDRIQRERRESEPMYHLHPRDGGFPPYPERGPNSRESFPPRYRSQGMYPDEMDDGPARPRYPRYDGPPPPPRDGGGGGRGWYPPSHRGRGRGYDNNMRGGYHGPPGDRGYPPPSRPYRGRGRGF